MYQLDAQQSAQAWAFLISVGTIALSELKERWSLRHKSSDGETISISNSEDGTPPPYFPEMIKVKSQTDIERVLNLVRLKRDNIYSWQKSREANAQELNEQLLSRAAFDAREERLQKQINAKIAEIERDLQSLGIEFDKEPY
jgi:hypothetical protein